MANIDSTSVENQEMNPSESRQEVTGTLGLIVEEAVSAVTTRAESANERSPVRPFVVKRPQLPHPKPPQSTNRDVLSAKPGGKNLSRVKANNMPNEPVVETTVPAKRNRATEIDHSRPTKKPNHPNPNPATTVTARSSSQSPEKLDNTLSFPTEKIPRIFYLDRISNQARPSRAELVSIASDSTQGQYSISFFHFWGSSPPSEQTGAPGDIFFLVSPSQHKIFARLDAWVEWPGLHYPSFQWFRHPELPGVVLWMDETKATWTTTADFMERYRRLSASRNTPPGGILISAQECLQKTLPKTRLKAFARSIPGGYEWTGMLLAWRSRLEQLRQLNLRLQEQVQKLKLAKETASAHPSSPKALNMGEIGVQTGNCIDESMAQNAPHMVEMGIQTDTDTRVDGESMTGAFCIKNVTIAVLIFVYFAAQYIAPLPQDDVLEAAAATQSLADSMESIVEPGSVPVHFLGLRLETNLCTTSAAVPSPSSVPTDSLFHKEDILPSSCGRPATSEELTDSVRATWADSTARQPFPDNPASPLLVDDLEVTAPLKRDEFGTPLRPRGDSNFSILSTLDSTPQTPSVLSKNSEKSMRMPNFLYF
ncbi:hypothetical protein DXG03_004391 [Asterophora parasitica]|uniref:Uncharacterized protein n=1 Tax=Asterophora parasitica TaxID=117018 RepID=A0A9P7G2F7_9AGAR|nr:hypothetical protein DXG03_004391 [Asterophora parasitica]